MDKRFFLALLLTGGVVLMTPVLFPRPEAPAPTATPALVDSSATASAPTATPNTAQATIAPAPEGIRAPTAPAEPVRAESIAVTNELATFRFSTLGASLVNVDLPRFRRLGNGAGAVQLGDARDPLVRFSILAGRDTIALDRIAFTSQRSTSATGETITFTGVAGAATVRVEYLVARDNYLAQVRIAATGLPQPAFLLTDLPRGFVSQEADTTEDARHLAYAYKPQLSGAERVDFRKPDPGERILESGPHTWVVAKSKYFLVGLLTPRDAPPAFAELQVTGDVRVNKVAVRARGLAVSALPDSGLAFELYAGPIEWERMVAMGREFENANPYGGWISGVVQPFATIVMRILLWMKRTMNIEYGWILVLFGIAVRLLMWPLNSRMMRSQIAMQRLAPKVQEAQNKHKGDPEKQRVAVMKVYEEAGVSPFAALSGCLPMLLPMPILIALFFVFQNTIEFRGVSFLYLADISLKDPYYILPLAMGLSMYALSWVGMRNAPPNPQTKMMAILMPVILTVALLNFASGLNLYYTVQNLAALPQQWLIANERGKAAPAVVAGGGGAKKS